MSTYVHNMADGACITTWLASRRKIWRMETAVGGLSRDSVVLNRQATNATMTLMSHNLNLAITWVMCLLLMSPMILWHLPGNECPAENDPAEDGAETEIAEVGLCMANSSHRQARRDRCVVQCMHHCPPGLRSSPKASRIQRSSAGQVSLQGRCDLLTC